MNVMVGDYFISRLGARSMSARARVLHRRLHANKDNLSGASTMRDTDSKLSKGYRTLMLSWMF